MLRRERYPVAAASCLGIAAAVLLSSCAAPPRQESSAADAPSKLIFIPGGQFLMGKDGEGDCEPAHLVRVESFYMDECEVTNAEYLAFCRATDHPLPEFWGMDEFHSGPGFPDHPVVGVSWRDAQTYADWAGKRLPTEAEWEYAARGGLVGMDYPCGPEIDPALANYFVRDPAQRDRYIGGTVAVGNYPPNGYGLHDMAGNVVEYYKESPPASPAGPEKGKFRVIRGGGWHSGPYCNRVYYRNALPGQWLDFNVGFRCAKDADGKVTVDAPPRK
jgi:sulfatase modifying factor 1